ncbi:MAG: hypothetical protein HWE27_16270 [Gammaproteobacteria bacterium]|nr:hypothetical protein [Gammaproteobacteria bacterium]
MSYLNSKVYASFQTKKSKESFLKYFDFDKRPRFTDDVSNTEAHLVEPSEFLPYPSSILQIEEDSVILDFNLDSDADNTLIAIFKISEHFGTPEIYAFLDAGAEQKDYVKVSARGVKTLYLPYNEDFGQHDSSIDEKLESLDFNDAALKYIVDLFK